MYNINRDYLIVLNPKTSKVTVPELNYYIYDKYTANLFVNLVTVENGKAVNIPDADQYKLVLHVLKPTNEIQDVENIELISKEKALFQIELNQELTKNIGRYKCELLTIDKNDHVVQSAKFSYRVKKSIYNDLDVVTETPQYPIIITLLDKLQDIDKYEEERRANEVARVAAEKARVKDYTDLRQTVTTDINTMQEKIDSFDGKVQEVDSAVQQMRTNITNYQTEKNKELDNYKTQKDTQINTAIKGMKTTIDTYKTEKDKQINDKISQQDTKIDNAIDLQNKNIQASTKALNDKLDVAVQDQNNTIAANNQAQNKVISDAVAAQNKTINTVVESDKVQNDRLDTLETSDTNNKAEIKKLQDTDVEHEERMTAIEAVNIEQNDRLDAIEIKNDQQDSRLNDVEAKNKKQDLDLKCLFAESHSERITLEDEVGNSVFLQNSKQGFATVDELKGNTLVNCNKDTDKELILNGNIDTSGYGTVTTTEGVDGGLVDVALEGNTMVNVCDQEEPIAITKSYEVTTGNHVALQGEYDGKCRPVLNGNTLVSYQKSSIDKGNQFTVNGQYQYKSISTLNTTVKDKLYFRIKFTVDELNTTSQEVNIFTHYPGGYMTPVKLFKDCTVGKIEEVSTIREHEQARADQKYMMLSIGMYAPMPEDVPQGSPVCKYTIHDYVIYNLTQLFGAGKEPEQKWCDKNLPYLEGMQSSFEDNYVPENLASSELYTNNEKLVVSDDYIEYNTQTEDGQPGCYVDLPNLKPSTDYTIVFNMHDYSEGVLHFRLAKDLTTASNEIWTQNNGLKVFKLTSKADIVPNKLFIFNRNNMNNHYKISKKVYIIEGDYTNYDFTNYDSSKGGKYKVDYKITGKNKVKLISSNLYKNVAGLTIDSVNDNELTFSITDATTNWQYIRHKLTELKPNTDYVFSFTISSGDTSLYARIYADSTPIDTTIENNNKKRKFNTGNYNNIYVRFFGIMDVSPSSNTVTYSNIQLEEGTKATIYEPYKESIKTFYLNSPLLEGDTIEDVNGKATHVHRYNTITFDGSDDESWLRQKVLDTQNTERYYIEDNTVKRFSRVLCDILPTAMAGERDDLTHLYIHNDVKRFDIKKLKTDTRWNDVATLKTWLQQNPVTVVYELETPTYETISNDSILCDSYVNGHLDVDSIIPIDKVDFKNADIDLKYVNANTEYIIQFESDNDGKVDIYNGSGLLRNINVTKGLNKVIITSDSNGYSGTNWSGIGFNASNIVVTPKVEQTFGYFKGMKSVGECEGNTVEIVAQNKNLLSYPYYNTTKTVSGITITDNGNGSLTLNGTSTSIINFYLAETNKWQLPSGKYILSCNNTLVTVLAGGTFSDIGYNASKGSIIFNVKEGAKLFGNLILQIKSNTTFNNVTIYPQLEKNTTPTDYTPPKENKQTITHEPLRGLPNGIKDKYVIIDGKWYIERNCMAVQFKDLKYSRTDVYQKAEFPDVIGFRLSNTGIQPPIMCDRFAYTNDRIINFGELLTNKEAINITSSNTMDEFFITINKTKLTTLDSKGLIKYFTDNPMEIITKATTPTYEPIEYNSFEVYSNTTHISNNSNIPCNMVIRNSGFNCMIKPNTTYTVSSNNGLSSVVTKASIGDSVLRFYDKDTTSVTKMSNVLVLEGDYITGNPPIPAFFKGMESTFEQELVTDEKDKNYGKYKVNVKAVGKNLFNKDTVIKGKYQNCDTNTNNFNITNHPNYNISDFVPVKPNTQYTISGTDIKYHAYYDINKEPIKRTGTVNTIFTTPSNAYYMIFNLNSTDDLNKIQIERGAKATEYEPYKENNITFYLKEPLRGVGDVKDKVYVKEDKVVVERNCASYVLDPNKIPSPSPGNTKLYMYNIAANNSIINTRYGKVVCNSFACDVNNAHDRSRANTISTVVDGTVPNGVIRIITDKNKETLKQYLQQNPTTVIYQLATPTYEEVEYFDLKLFVEIFKDTTIIYNSSIPVTSTINYTYSTPLTDAVNTVSDISDQQDSMIIDMATQVATMEMMLM